MWYRRESRGVQFHPKIHPQVSRFKKKKRFLEGKLESHRFKWLGQFILHTLTYDLKWLSNPSSWHWATTWIMTLYTTGMNKAMNSNVRMDTLNYYHSSRRSMRMLLSPQETRNSMGPPHMGSEEVAYVSCLTHTSVPDRYNCAPDVDRLDGKDSIHLPTLLTVSHWQRLPRELLWGGRGTAGWGWWARRRSSRGLPWRADSANSRGGWGAESESAFAK